MRVPLQHLGCGVELRLAEYLGNPRFEIVDRAGMDAERLPQLEPDTERRIECRGRILGNVGHLRPTQLPQLAWFELEEVLAVETNFARRDVESAPGMTEERESYGRLARAGLADEPEQLRGVNGEGHIAHDLRSIRGELNPEVLDLQPYGVSLGHVVDGVVGQGTHAAIPVSSVRASSGRFSTPMATRATASVNVLIPMVSRAMRMAGTATAQTFRDKPMRFS